MWEVASGLREGPTPPGAPGVPCVVRGAEPAGGAMLWMETGDVAPLPGRPLGTGGVRLPVSGPGMWEGTEGRTDGQPRDICPSCHLGRLSTCCVPDTTCPWELPSRVWALKRSEGRKCYEKTKAERILERNRVSSDGGSQGVSLRKA